MPSSTVKVRSSQGGAFDCYLALPDATEPVPAMVLGMLCAFLAWRLWREQGALIAPGI